MARTQQPISFSTPFKSSVKWSVFVLTKAVIWFKALPQARFGLSDHRETAVSYVLNLKCTNDFKHRVSWIHSLALIFVRAAPSKTSFNKNGFDTSLTLRILSFQMFPPVTSPVISVCNVMSTGFISSRTAFVHIKS